MDALVSGFVVFLFEGSVGVGKIILWLVVVVIVREQGCCVFVM